MQMDREENRMMNAVKTALTLVFLALLGFGSMAQEVQFSTRLDTSNILIGDQVNYRMQLRIPQGYPFEWPRLADSLTSKVEILSMGTIDTVAGKDGFITVNQVFTITSFDTGYYLIPPVAIKYKESNQSDEILMTESEPFLLNVFSIPVDLSQPIKPIKGPIAVPITFREILPWILLVLAVGAIIWFFAKRKKKAAPITIFKPKPKLPPHVIAMDELEKLKREKLWQQGFIKDYYSRLSEVIRQYIEDQYSIPAIESTTYDTMQLVRRKGLGLEAIKILQDLLELADLVKFAKAKPLPSEHDHSMNSAVRFVKITSPVFSASEILPENDKPSSDAIEKSDSGQQNTVNQ